MSNLNVDVIIYLNNLIKDLKEEDFFDETVNPLMDEDIFRKHAAIYCIENLTEFKDPTLDTLQFEKIIFETHSEVIQETVNSLYKKELLEVVGMNQDGHVLYAPSKKAKEIFQKD